jgi:hypothetical protein
MRSCVFRAAWLPAQFGISSAPGQRITATFPPPEATFPAICCVSKGAAMPGNVEKPFAAGSDYGKGRVEPCEETIFFDQR